MAELKLGYKASAEQFAPRELVELAVAAEAHGMDSATVSDHFQPWRHQGGHAPFSLSWMTAVGERTNRLLLGTSVLTPTFRYNPAVIAQAFATMGCLYPNRVFLGVGTGEALNEIATGYEGAWPEFKERFARLRESVGLMRQLWSGDRVDFDGDYYRLKGASIYDVPDGGVPVYIAAGGPAVAKYAGRAGDGFICTSGKGEELYTEKLMPAVREGAAAADRSVDGIDKMIEIKISYDPDPELALNNTRFWAPLSLTAEQKHSIDDPIEMEKAADALPIEQIAKRWIVASDPDEAVEKVGQYVTWGDLDGATVIEPCASELHDQFADQYAQLRKAKGITVEHAREIMNDATYFGTMLVHNCHADGMVSGAAHTTAHTVRPALEIIKTVPGISTVSSIFLMCLPDRVLAYGDCAIIPNPTVEQLADIAICSARTAAQFGIEPRVAMLSYSTGDSGKGADVDKVRAATELVRAREPQLPVEGPIQYDAAVEPSVAATKLRDSPVAGRATVLIFPDLNTGNNTYKAVQRSAGAIAIGPVLQGLRKPVNDLSRGALVDDIVNTVAITAIQAQGVHE